MLEQAGPQRARSMQATGEARSQWTIQCINEQVIQMMANAADFPAFGACHCVRIDTGMSSHCNVALMHARLRNCA
ncbi:hypothetical protein FDU21_14020 [Xanthomonas oryzae pv. oryzae]|nr:hypothetical protein FDU21_14020 [Xanthomonas oryzae pv. oryzae]